MNSTIIEIRDEISKLKSSKRPIPEQLKFKTASLLDNDYSTRKLAKLINIHHTTLVKWNKNRPKVLGESGDQQTHHQWPPVCYCGVDGDNNRINVTNNDNFHGSPPISGDKPSKIPRYLLFLLVTIAIISELYLLNQSYLFHKETLGEGKMAFVKAGLGEAVPIVITILLYLKQVTLGFLDKFILRGCLLVSFLFSAYTSGGHGLNSASDKIQEATLIKKEIERIQDTLTKNEKSINFYRLRPQSDGSIGWPMTVKRLSEVSKNLNMKIELLTNKLSDIGDVKLKSLNKWFDLTLKLLVQLSVLFVITIIMKLNFE